MLSTAGWIGVIAQLGAYALVSRGSLSGASPRYHSCNVLGAALMASSAAALGNWAVVVGQLVWLGLGAAALSSEAGRRRARSRPRHSTAGSSHTAPVPRGRLVAGVEQGTAAQAEAPAADAAVQTVPQQLDAPDLLVQPRAPGPAQPMPIRLLR